MGGAPSRGTPTQNGAVDSRRSSPPNGATRIEPAALTKWIEIKPAAAARSAHSPTRPTWPELRSEMAERPRRLRFFNADVDGHRRHRLTEAKAAVDDADDRSVNKTFDRLVGNEVACADPIDVTRHADDAVAVVSSEIGVDERGGDAVRLFGPAADASENFSAKVR